MIDQQDRRSIRESLDETIIVEAAAGTGKTTELVSRILHVLAEGRATVDRIVAVTFTEKAAGELKLRLREELERARQALRDQAQTDERRERRLRLDAALERLEEAHVSTIHGFCADLLRERPVEARVDPMFQVLTEPQSERLYHEAFRTWIQAQLEDPPEGVRRSMRRSVWMPDRAASNDAGPIDRLRRAGRDLVEWRDFPATWRRDAFDREAEIDRLVARVHAFADLTGSPSSRGDNFYVDTAAARQLSHDVRHTESGVEPGQTRSVRDYDGWEARLVSLGRDYTFRRARKGSGRTYGPDVLRGDVHAAREELALELDAFRRAADADLAARLHDELAGCVAAYEALKARAGALDFVDLLIQARALVRDNDAVRRRFQDHIDCLFVDEFQDTDPLQAEILLLLAADDPAERDWRRTRPLPGKLFIVGDPKQSIYRFRRADVGVYHEVCDWLKARGARSLKLTTSFRSKIGIQRVINAAFEPQMAGDRIALQASYVPLSPFREDDPAQPSVVALPVPKPYGPYRLSGEAIGPSLADAVGAFVHWLVTESGWKVSARDETAPWTQSSPPDRRGARLVAIEPRHVCVLFRRFTHRGEDVTQPYVQALEARGVAHLLVGGRTYHGREEVETLRAALAAIEWPDDELSVFATLRGALFAIGDEELLEYRHRFGHVHPFRVPDGVPSHLVPIVDALALLKRLHLGRNHRPVADTISRLLDATRAHVALVLRPAGEQALANVLHVSELARQYEASGGISFRGFVEDLRDSAETSQAGEAPILEEGSDGVRLMTVHKAKGLEFPVVILADMTAKLCQLEAGRYIDTSRALCVQKIAGWSPIELLEHDAEELERERAEGVRVAYVAATRARDLLVLPAIGDQPWDGGWVSPLNAALYPPLSSRRSAEAAPGCPSFKKDSVLTRPDGDPAGPETVCPGLHVFDHPNGDPAARHAVVWWDPFVLDLNAEPPFGLRHPELIAKQVDEAVLAERTRAYTDWRMRRADAVARGSEPSLRVKTATQWVRAGATAEPLAEQPGLWDAPDPAADVEIVDAAAASRSRPAGAAFGTLVHAILATVPLDASGSTVRALAAVQGRVLGASDGDIEAAAVAAIEALRHPLMDRARAAHASGRCRRESPVTFLTPGGTLIEGTVDLAFEEGPGSVVVDFKSDREIEGAQDRYLQQLRFYAAALARVTGRPATAILMKV
jgi:ATP-dependent exoDNAse (exonuclease V) beta subunit